MPILPSSIFPPTFSLFLFTSSFSLSLSWSLQLIFRQKPCYLANVAFYTQPKYLFYHHQFFSLFFSFSFYVFTCTISLSSLCTNRIPISIDGGRGATISKNVWISTGCDGKDVSVWRKR
ncbi:hypothetical protein RchiOBHm_Chr4g0385471 [Rosa chinensis]|uniref:Uncharacterized protein n=1 Tax=Rosa chinensis TaxID=74649 RepID=A0A2P6QP19_ROSCH|nr:hypothetical protein RchiOBHm_Chr4g0385471 [Rosa chinensis]